MRDATLTVLGMGCVRCEDRVETRLINETGVQRVVATHETDTVTVVLDPDSTALDELTSLVDAYGYDVIEATYDHPLDA